MEPVVVTGAAGFVGAALSTRLVAEGFPVVGVDDLSTGKLDDVPSEVDFIEGDLADRQIVQQFPKGVSTVFHLAGQSSGEISFDDPVGDLQRNVVTTLRLIEWCAEHGSPRLVLASSMSVYGHQDDPVGVVELSVTRPLSCYGVGKLAAEQYLHVYRDRVPSVALRMFNTYGPGQNLDNLRQGMVSIFVAQAIREGRILVKGSLDRFRDLVHIDDMIEVWMRAGRAEGAIGRILNVGSGVKTSVGELTSMISAAVGGCPVDTTGGTPGDQFGITASTDLLRSVLGFVPSIPVSEGVNRFVDWAAQLRQ
jgi:UDP-glucose 4-epimerase